MKSKEAEIQADRYRKDTANMYHIVWLD